MTIIVDGNWTSGSGSTSPPGLIPGFEAITQVGATQLAVYFYAVRKVSGTYPTVTSAKLVDSDFSTELGNLGAGTYVETGATGDEGYRIYSYFSYGIAHYGLKLNVDTDPYREVYGAIVASGSGVEQWQITLAEPVPSDVGQVDIPLDVELDLLGGESFIAFFALGTSHANDTSFTNVTSSDPAWTIGDKLFFTPAGAFAARRVGAAIGYYIGTAIDPPTTISIVRSGAAAASGGVIAVGFGLMGDPAPEQAWDALSTVATIDHDLLTGQEANQHHDQIHPLDETVHTGGFFHRAAAGAIITDADFTTPTNGMVAMTSDTDTGITLLWTRHAGTWEAVEVTV